MPRLTDAEQTEFLAEPGILMRISVVRADGSPLVTPLWFIHEDGQIYFTPRARSEWYGCLVRDPRVALCIDEQPLPYRKLVIEGRAELVHDLGADADWRDLYHRIASRYVGARGADAYIAATLNEPRALFRVSLTAARQRSWRMPIGDEPGDGIWHPRYYTSPTTRRNA